METIEKHLLNFSVDRVSQMLICLYCHLGVLEALQVCVTSEASYKCAVEACLVGDNDSADRRQLQKKDASSVSFRFSC